MEEEPETGDLKEDRNLVFRQKGLEALPLGGRLVDDKEGEGAVPP